MVQKIKQANIFGRIGSGIGQGLSEQIPKEIERNRLAAGLKELENQKDLSPFQQFSRLSAIPGITPQMIQSGSELLRQQGMLRGLQKNGPIDQRKPTFEDIKPKENAKTPGQRPRSITTPEGVQATINPVLPMNTTQKQQLALQLNKENPGLYPDLPTALAGAEQIDRENQALNQAQQAKRQGRKDVQDTVKEELKQRAETLGLKEGINLPGDVLSDIQDKAISEILKGELSEKEVAANYGKEIDKIMREYADVKAIGGLGILTKKPGETISQFKRLQKKFADRNDTRNLADTMVGENGISYPLAYSLAEPISQYPEVMSSLKEIPSLERKETLFETVIPDKIERTREIAPKLAEALKKNDASPLSIAYELKKKGYDPSTWLSYLSDNANKLNLRPSQVEQLTKETGYFFEPLNDLWLSEWTGLGE